MVNSAKGFLAFVVLFAAAIVVLCVHAFLPPVSTGKLAHLNKGTPQKEVERILGRPKEVLKPSVFWEEAWRYQVSLRFGWVDIFFDKQGTVMHYNYERF